MTHTDDFTSSRGYCECGTFILRCPKHSDGEAIVEVTFWFTNAGRYLRIEREEWSVPGLAIDTVTQEGVNIWPRLTFKPFNLPEIVEGAILAAKKEQSLEQALQG